MTDLNKLISELIPIKQTFLSYAQLAGGQYRFDGKIFRKSADKIQEVIDKVKELTTNAR